MSTQYHAVDGGVKDSGYWMPFLKQFHICSGAWILYFLMGLGTGAPTVMIPQIRRDWNSTITVDDELASWLYSASNFAAIPWLFFLPALTQFLGRKLPFLACCIAMSAFFSLLFFSSAPYQILIAQVIQGFVNANGVTVLIHIIPEYCNPRYRNMFLNVQCTTYYWGIWASNAIGTFANWKYIAILGLICSLYTFTVSFYPESPRWLASKGKISECEAAHRWLRGYSRESETELRDLIKSQAVSQKHGSKMSCSRLLKTLKYKPFYMPLLLVILVGAQYNFSGKFVCSIYAIEVLKKITKNESTAYTGMLILDGVTVFGMYIGCVLSKILKMRSLLFSLTFVSIFVMFTFSLYLYLVKLQIVQENNIVTLGLLVVYSLSISSGPVILCLSIYSELISIKYQAVSYVIASFCYLVSCTGMLKFSPVFFREFGIHGSFLFYGITSGITTVLLYIYLPETKGKTLEEIGECFKDTNRYPEAEVLTKPVEAEVK